MGVDISAVASVLGIEVEYKDLRGSSVVFLPQAVAVVGQGASASTYSTDPVQSSSPSDIGSAYGFGSPLHLAAKALFPVNGDGLGTIPATFYPVEDDGSGVAAQGSIAPTGTPTATAAIRVYVGEVRSDAITIVASDSVAIMCDKIFAGISAILDMPVTAVDAATSVDFTAKWKGSSGNDIAIRIDGTVPGVTFGVTAMAGGLVNPDIDPALAKMTTRWETKVVNCMEPGDTDTLDKLQVHGEGRWGALERKPYLAYTGRTAAEPPAADAESDGRRTDRINVFLVNPDSTELPFIVAAEQVAKIAKRANEDPAFDYGGLRVPGLLPGSDAEQWTYPQRDQALKRGCSTIVVNDGVVNIADVVTMYHPTGDSLPAYRYGVDVVKLQNCIFNLDLVFATQTWKAAPLIPDGQATTNKNARTPKMAVAAVNTRLEALGLAAIISDPETAKASTRAWIDSQNPKRLNVETTVQLSGNLGIVSVTLNFGFKFGAAQLAA